MGVRHVRQAPSPIGDITPFISLEGNRIPDMGILPCFTVYFSHNLI